jgi:hypothetical protein|tara:strand:+ start:869 stop:1255 length:387 start_codon:yes stop_codon:yes gene_type:complete
MKRYNNTYDINDGDMVESRDGEWVLYEDVKDDLEYLDKILDVLQDMPVDIDEIKVKISTTKEFLETVRILESRFKSGNSIPVESSRITKEEFNVLLSEVEHLIINNELLLIENYKLNNGEYEEVWDEH